MCRVGEMLWELRLRKPRRHCRSHPESIQGCSRSRLPLGQEMPVQVSQALLHFKLFDSSSWVARREASRRDLLSTFQRRSGVACRLWVVLPVATDRPPRESTAALLHRDFPGFGGSADSCLHPIPARASCSSHHFAARLPVSRAGPDRMNSLRATLNRVQPYRRCDQFARGTSCRGASPEPLLFRPTPNHSLTAGALRWPCPVGPRAPTKVNQGQGSRIPSSGPFHRRRW